MLVPYCTSELKPRGLVAQAIQLKLFSRIKTQESESYRIVSNEGGNCVQKIAHGGRDEGPRSLYGMNSVNAG
jgi:hypothetical protein